MNPNTTQRLLLSLSTIRSWLILFGVIWLVGFLGLGWLVKSLFVLFALVLLTPVVLFLGLRWWLGRNLIQAPCPVCGFAMAGLNNSQTRCPNCNESLQASNGQFQRITPPGTVDVEAVEVKAQVVED